MLERFNKVWLFPKGHIDSGETAPQAALREVKEECGLEARILEDIGETSYTFFEKDEEHLKSVQWYLMEAVSSEITPEAGFFTAARLITELEIGLLSFDSDRQLAKQGFELYKSYRKEFD